MVAGDPGAADEEEQQVPRVNAARRRGDDRDDDEDNELEQREGADEIDARMPRRVGGGGKKTRKTKRMKMLTRDRTTKRSRKWTKNENVGAEERYAGDRDA